MNRQENEIIQKIKTAKSAVVVAHVNPDGDTLGSMLALAKVLEQVGLKVDRVMHDRVPEVYKFFPDQEKVISTSLLSQAHKSQYDLSFSCDCGSVDRLGSAGEIWKSAKVTCNIDHHLSNPLFGDLNWVNPNATSTGQVVSFMAKALNDSDCDIKIDKDLASLLYITLLTDTGGFRHRNTNGTVFLWAAELVSFGADPSELYNKLFNQIPFKAIKVIGDALSKIEFVSTNSYKSIPKNFKFIYTQTERQLLDSLGATDEDTEEIVDHIMRIKNLDMCLYLREGAKVNSFKGSLRSACDIDCSKIAQQLGGGGHARAAGFNIQIDKKKINEVKELVLNLIDGAYRIGN